MSMADSMISIWHSKMTYGFWRPITAIQQADSDGNSATAPEPNWQPLLPTPPYPDYVEWYSGLMGAFARGLRQTFRTQDPQLTLISTAVPTSNAATTQKKQLAKTWSTPGSGWASTSAARTSAVPRWANRSPTGHSITTSSR